jgi:hypothetical protein
MLDRNSASRVRATGNRNAPVPADLASWLAQRVQPRLRMNIPILVYSLEAIAMAELTDNQ